MTSLSDIFDLFMMTITDYRLTALFNTSESDFENYLEAWLRMAIVEFARICDQSLEYSSSTHLFTVVLTDRNQIILATLMMKYWMQKSVNDITQMNLHITDRDFKIASEAQNLLAKKARLESVREECSQMLSDYSYDNNDWDNWFDQSFSGG